MIRHRMRMLLASACRCYLHPTKAPPRRLPCRSALDDVACSCIQSYLAPLVAQSLEVSLPDIMEVLVMAIDVITQVLHLVVIHFQLGSHLLHMLCLLLEILAVPCQLFCNFWTRLSCNYVLQLYIHFLLLLDQSIL